MEASLPSCCAWAGDSLGGIAGAGQNMVWSLLPCFTSNSSAVCRPADMAASQAAEEVGQLLHLSIIHYMVNNLAHL